MANIVAMVAEAAPPCAACGVENDGVKGAVPMYIPPLAADECVSCWVCGACACACGVANAMAATGTLIGVANSMSEEPDGPARCMVCA